MLNACTIIACNYLPFARVLADSFFLHHPSGSFTVLLVDDEDRRVAPEDDRIDWRRLGDLGLDPIEIRRLAGIYDVTELSTAVKPVLLRRMLEEGRTAVVYLDPDIRIYDAIEEAGTLAERHSIILTPHMMRPFPRDGRRVDEFFVLAAGVYNLGFIGVGASALPFLDWWWQSTRRDGLVDIARMMFTDQRWIDFVPSFFDHHLVKDPTWNVAYWNLHARELTAERDRYFVNGRPLRFFHFSGFDVREPWLLSRHQGDRPRILLSERPPLARICREYAASLERMGFTSSDAPPYGWRTLPSGVPLDTTMRRLYRTALLDAEAGGGPEPPGPFDESRPEAFLAWLNTPPEGGPRRVSRYLHAIHEGRPDLQMHFPDLDGAHASSFLNWIRKDGVAQIRIPHELLPPQDEGPTAVTAPCAMEPGVRIAGYFRAELGIGEAARLLAGAVDAAGLPYSTMTYGATVSRQDHPFQEREGSSAGDVNVLCVNADATPRFRRDVGPGFFAGRHTVGYWFWEIERFPEALHPAFDVVDEVWTATNFVADAVRRAGGKPVFTVPLPVPVPRCSPNITRERLGLPHRFTFLFLFDFLSILERKNPLGLIEAFKTAFSPGEGPVLVIKSINGDLRIGALERLRAAAADRPDIVIVDGYFAAAEKDALIGLCDCYVSLHRSEGLGLTMAEAMALGKPVIGTGYSGNLHFMHSGNSFLVDYVLTAVPAGCEPYPEGSVWAEPDLDDCARLMRQVYERPETAARKARRGQADVRTRHDVRASARAVAQRLARIRDARQVRIAGSQSGAARDVPPPPAVAVDADGVGPAQAIGALLPQLAQLSAPRLSVEGRRFPRLRLAAQRAFFRVLRPYWFQQRRFNDQLVLALHQLAAGLQSMERTRGAVDVRLQAVATRLDNRTDAIQAHTASLEERTSTIIEQATTRIDGSERALQQLESSLSTLCRSVDARTATVTEHTTARVNSAEHAVHQLQGSLTTLSQRLYAVPFMTDPREFIDTDGRGCERLGYRSTTATVPEVCLRFQEIFRGPEALIRDRQRVYLPLLHAHAKVVDLGCGRGEMLDLLSEARIPAVGVDIDPDMIRHSRTKGHTVEEADVLSFLERQPPASLPALFSAQVIEHLAADRLQVLLALCRSRLHPGGVLIAETVNPHALEAFKTFHTDLTHQRPIFPEVALALCQIAGFEQAHVMFPLGNGDLTRDRQERGEYAVVATAGVTPPSPASATTG